MSLKQELDNQRESSRKLIPKDKWRIMEKSDGQLSNSGILQRCLNIGDAAPDFELPNALGEFISLKELLKEGPLVLSFYRGGW